MRSAAVLRFIKGFITFNFSLFSGVTSSWRLSSCTVGFTQLDYALIYVVLSCEHEGHATDTLLSKQRPNRSRKPSITACHTQNLGTCRGNVRNCIWLPFLTQSPSEVKRNANVAASTRKFFLFHFSTNLFETLTRV
jgi:hypothetical protein